MTFSKNGKPPHQLSGTPLRNGRTVTRRAPRIPDTAEWKRTHARIRACGLTTLEASALLLWSSGLNCRAMARRLARSERQTWKALQSGCDRLLVRSRKEAKAVLICFNTVTFSGDDKDDNSPCEPLVMRRSLVNVDDLTADLEKVAAGV